MRFFLAQDNSCHWYLVEAAKRAAWDAWLNLDEDDSASWTEPTYARALGGSPSEVTFAEPNALYLFGEAK